MKNAIKPRHNINGCVRVRRLPGEQLLFPCTASHAQPGDGVILPQDVLPEVGKIQSTLLMWDQWTTKCMNYLVSHTLTGILFSLLEMDVYRGRSPLEKFNTPETPYIAVFQNGNGIFQQNNTPSNKNRIVLEKFEEHNSQLQFTAPAL
ncbi:hypothetical protein TNCV_2631211 [Trichonephila clavipes]|nr:hypothetical protein TNCV_2631211 [Trichonephila clavipes]